MRISLGSVVRPITLSIAAIALIGLGQGAARADEVFISGSTAGCFGAPCAPIPSDTFLGLSYNNSTFSGTTAGGFLGIGGGVNNLGSLTLTADPHLYDGQTFTLQVTFTAPQGIDGSNVATFEAELTGEVISAVQGGVMIVFSGAPLQFTFNDVNCEGGPTTCGIGSFFFSVNDLSVSPGETETITGQITGAQQTPIPEPASMLLLGTGLAGLAGAVRRKLKTRQAK